MLWRMWLRHLNDERVAVEVGLKATRTAESASTYPAPPAAKVVVAACWLASNTPTFCSRLGKQHLWVGLLDLHSGTLGFL